jgi:hypothetical protein
VQTTATLRRIGAAARIAAAGLMLSLWLSTLLLSMSPGLHELVHDDSRSDGHQCLVTCFSKSQILSGTSAGAVLASGPVRFTVPPPVDLPFVSQPENRLLRGRAPPSPHSSQPG